MKIQDLIKQEKKLTDEALGQFLSQVETEASREDEGYGRMVGMIIDQVLRGGKRIRPALVRWGYRLAGREVNDAVMQASLATELIHQFFLVHDDIVDRDYQRYGEATIEVAFGEQFRGKFGEDNRHYATSMAMIAGDLLRGWGFRSLWQAKLDETKKLVGAELLTRVIEQTICGWQIQYELNFEQIDPGQEERFMTGLDLVTGRYTFEVPLLLGLVLAGKKDELGEKVRKYARSVGIAYQMMDDVLGVFGESKVLGKPVGNDVREGKKTLLVLWAYASASKSEKLKLQELVGKNDLDRGELDVVREIMMKTGVYEKVLQMAKNKAEEASDVAQEMVGVNTEVSENLCELAKFVARRQY